MLFRDEHDRSAKRTLVETLLAVGRRRGTCARTLQSWHPRKCFGASNMTRRAVAVCLSSDKHLLAQQSQQTSGHNFLLKTLLSGISDANPGRSDLSPPQLHPPGGDGLPFGCRSLPCG